MIVIVFICSLVLFFLLYAAALKHASAGHQNQGSDTLGDLLHVGALVAISIMLLGLGAAVYLMNGAGLL